MSNENLPIVLIEQASWQQIKTEVEYWADKGKKAGSGPLESVFYPLAAVMLRKDVHCTPFAPIELGDVQYLAVLKTFIPPREYANYSSFAAEFRAPDGNNKKMQRLFTREITKISKKRPQLLFLGPGHSHPFAVESTSPSTTDIEHHIRPYRRKNEEVLGLRFSVALIVVQSRIKGEWQICAFAMNGDEEIVPLEVRFAGRYSDSNLIKAYSRPFFRTLRGKRWEAAQRARLGDKLLQHDHWVGGWSTFLYRCDSEIARLVILPPHFPKQPPLEQTINLLDQSAGELRQWNFGDAYQNYQLGENVYGNLLQEL